MGDIFSTNNETMSDNETYWELDLDEDLKCDVDELQTTPFYLLIPATLLILIFMLMEIRKNLYPNCCWGHFGIVVPFNLIENKNNRLPYIAVFILISLSAAKVFTKDSYQLMGIETGDHLAIILLKQLYIIIICLIFFPIFASCSTQNILGLLLGVSYSIAFIIVKTYQVFSKLTENSCDLMSLNPRNATSLLLFLILTYGSGVCFIGCQLTRITFKITQCKQEGVSVKNRALTDYASIYTNHLLLSEKKILEPRPFNGKNMLVKKALYKMHPMMPGFRYSLAILASIAMALAIIFYFTSLWTIETFQIWMAIRSSLKESFAGVNETISAANIFLYLSNKFLLKSKGKIDKSINMSLSDYLQEQVTIVFLSNIVALSVSFISICLISLHMLKSYRHDMKKLYKSDVIAKQLETSNHVQLLVYANKFVGYQVAYFFWGFFLQFICLWIFLTIISLIIIFPLVHGMWGYLGGFFYSFMPTMVMMWVVYMLQYLLIKYLFVQDRGKYLALDNRRGYMNLMYFFLFYNMLLGLFSCLKRILKSMVFGLLFIPRLDKSIMPKTFEKYDAGFRSYVCLMKLEALQTNPILMTFLSELYKEVKQRRRKIVSSKSKQTQEALMKDLQYKKSKIAKTRWFLAWTLIFNPSLQVSRWNRERLKGRLDVIVVPRKNHLLENFDEPATASES